MVPSGSDLEATRKPNAAAAARGWSSWSRCATGLASLNWSIGDSGVRADGGRISASTTVRGRTYAYHRTIGYLRSASVAGHAA